MLFIIVIFFQVCELHFRPEDLEWETSFFDEKTGTNVKPSLLSSTVYDDGLVMNIGSCDLITNCVVNKYELLLLSLSIILNHMHEKKYLTKKFKNSVKKCIKK